VIREFLILKIEMAGRKAKGKEKDEDESPNGNLGLLWDLIKNDPESLDLFQAKIESVSGRDTESANVRKRQKTSENGSETESDTKMSETLKGKRGEPEIEPKMAAKETEPREMLFNDDLSDFFPRIVWKGKVSHIHPEDYERTMEVNLAILRDALEMTAQRFDEICNGSFREVLACNNCLSKDDVIHMSKITNANGISVGENSARPNEKKSLVRFPKKEKKREKVQFGEK